MEIRFASIDDGAACNRFYNEGHQKRRTPAQWEWEFVGRHFPEFSLQYVIAEDQGKIVGSQAMIPVRMIDGSGVHWTAKSEETLVNPAYRGQKVFERMYEVLKRRAQSAGIRNIWGFTPATKAFTRIDFETPGKTSQVFYPFTGRAIPALVNKQSSASGKGGLGPAQRMAYRVAGALASVVSSSRFSLRSGAPQPEKAGLRVCLLTSAPAESGDVCREFIRQWGGCTIFRDTAYLQWRLFDNPHVKALFRGAYVGDQLCGWVAYALGDDGMGYLVDVIAIDAKGNKLTARTIARALLRTAVTDLRQMGAMGVRGWHVNDHPFDTLLLREAKTIGFWHLKWGHDVVVLPVPEHEAKPRAVDFRSWYVTRIYTEGLLG